MSRYLAIRGWTVTSTGRSPEPVEREVGGRLSSISRTPLALDSPASVIATVARLSTSGPYDLVILNAGSGTKGDQQANLLAVNLWGHVAFLEALHRARLLRRRSTVAVIVSDRALSVTWLGADVRSAPSDLAYALSKRGLLALASSPGLFEPGFADYEFLAVDPGSYFPSGMHYAGRPVQTSMVSALSAVIRALTAVGVLREDPEQFPPDQLPASVLGYANVGETLPPVRLDAARLSRSELRCVQQAWLTERPNWTGTSQLRT